MLAHYDPNELLILAADASAYGVGAVISHHFPDGTEQPIAYASRTLSDSERNYSQIDKEALSLVFGIKRFHNYLYGRQFTILTDHQPLTSILGPKQGIPPLAAARMQRWALTLSAYTYDITFRSTKSHANADSLSRLPLPAPKPVEDSEDPTIFDVAQLDALPVQASTVATETRADPLLCQVLQWARTGWPTEVTTPFSQYWARKNELTLQDNCILWGIRVVIPKVLQSQVLTELHRGHPGVVRMKAIARSHVWWPGLDRDIEECARSCAACQASKNLPAKAPLHPWAWPTAPWDRIHIDFAGPIIGKMLLVAVDAHSNWPEVCVMTTTTSAKTISALREMFAHLGIPRQLVSDNGPQFASEEFAQFMRANGVKHIRCAPYHPASNGAAERLVQTVKQAVKAGHRSGMPLEQTLASFLLHYRTTPHATTGVTPSSLMLGRELRTRLDLVMPEVAERVHTKQTQQKEYHDRHSQAQKLDVNQPVWARSFREGPQWVAVVVQDRLGPVSYLIRLDDGSLWRRHIDHLRAGSKQPSAEESGSPRNQEFMSQEGNDSFASLPLSTPAEQPCSTCSQGEPLTVNPDTNTDTAQTNAEIGSGLSPNKGSTATRYPRRQRQPPARLYAHMDEERS